jgi:hypothetical protein
MSDRTQRGQLAEFPTAGSSANGAAFREADLTIA